MVTIDEAKLVAAHKAGMAYWRNNRPDEASREQLAFHARTCGWRGELNDAWLAGFYGAKSRQD